MREPHTGGVLLLPGLLLFLGFGVTLFQSPEQAPVVLFLFMCFVILTALTFSQEAAFPLALLATALAFLGYRGIPAPGRYPWLAQIALLWVGFYGASRFLRRHDQDERDSASALTERQEQLLSLQRERETLEHQLAELSARSGLGLQVSTVVYQLAGLLDPVRIRQHFMESVRAVIRRGTIHFFSGAEPRDAVDQWVMEQRKPLLVTDVARDRRFSNRPPRSEIQSVLSAPLTMEGQAVGLLRLNGFEPGAFSTRDLHLLEAFSFLASSALENLQLSARLEEGAVEDSLTGLLNARSFVEALGDEVLRAGRYRTEFCFLHIEVDHLERCDSVYGNAAGDQLLVRIVHLMEGKIRPVDIVGRYGRRGFGLLMPETDRPTARAMAETLRDRVEKETFQLGSETAMQEPLSLSIGVSAFPWEATVASQLMRIAEMRLNQAKEAGGNRIIG